MGTQTAGSPAAQSWTAIISRAREAESGAPDLEAQVADLARNYLGLEVLIVPHLYDLREGHAAVEAIRALPGPLLVCAWLYPRAAYWTLKALGLSGARADTPQSALGEAPSGRPIFPVDLRGLSGAEAVLDQVKGLLPIPPPGRAGTIRRVDGPTDERWYPVLDYERCLNCLECAEFCLFGVYDVDSSGRIVARSPDRCKPGCPACSRVCPARAIMFPHHAGTPAIAGADQGEIEALSPETAAHDGLTKECTQAVSEHLAGVPCKCRPDQVCDHPEAPACPADCACDCHADPLDRAIDELDQKRGDS